MSEATAATIAITGITVFGVQTGIDPLVLAAAMSGALWSLTTLEKINWWVRPFAVFFASICSAWLSTLIFSMGAVMWKKWFGVELDVLSARPIIAALIGYVFLNTLPKLQTVVDRGIAKATKE